MEEEGLFYSEEALHNRILFLSDTNEINIIVEDVHKEFEYENIFERLLSGSVRINSIFPMGGKIAVKRAFEEYGDTFDGTPTVYLVDGDFDVMLERDLVISPNYIYLDKYNIESYYIDEKATLKFMAGKMKKIQKEVANEIEYEMWERDTYRKFEELFINYAVGQKELPEEINVGISPYMYIGEQGYVDERKVEAYIKQLKEKISNYDEVKNYYRQRYEEVLKSDASRLICGKYLLASLAQYLRKKTNTTFKEDDFRYYLLGEFDIKKLDFIKSRIESILSHA